MKESDIRPEHLHRRYLELSARDAETCFAGIGRSDIACVACGATGSAWQFRKEGFDYVRCTGCGTLYQSPRPPLAAFEAFYRNSESSRFWAEEFFPAVAEARRETIFRPRVDRLVQLCRDRNLRVERLIDVGAGFGLFLEEWRKQEPGTELLGVEPSRNLAETCRAKGFAIEETIVEDVRGRDGYADLVVCFEVLEHVHDPVEFVAILKRLARPGGYVFISTLGVDGFDIQTLWEKSNSIFPPHHINFLSLKGFAALFARAGLTEIDITTPGKLDVDIVRNAYARDRSCLEGNRFAKSILDDGARSDAFQSFLVSNKLSSHTWVIGRKQPAPP